MNKKLLFCALTLIVVGCAVLYWHGEDYVEYLTEEKACGLDCQLGNLRSSLLAMSAKMDLLNKEQTDQNQKIKKNEDEVQKINTRIQKEEEELNRSLGNPQEENTSGGPVETHLGEKGGVIHPPSNP